MCDIIQNWILWRYSGKVICERQGRSIVMHSEGNVSLSRAKELHNHVMPRMRWNSMVKHGMFGKGIDRWRIG